MPRTFEIITGHGRYPLVSRVTSQISQGGSQDLGQLEAARYSRFTGFLIASSVGVTGLVLRHRFAITSGGPFYATSSTTVTSGATAQSGTILDLINYGQFADFSIVSADSTTVYSILINGEPMR